MKKKKGLWILLGAMAALILATVLVVVSWVNTPYGILNTKLAIMLKFQQYFNPNSLDDKKAKKMRNSINSAFTRWSAQPIPFSNIKNINIFTASKQISVRIYTPNGNAPFPIVIYAHGGAWVGGSIDTHDNVCRKLAKYTNAVVVSVGYRLAPENPFPAGLDDVYDVLQWTFKNAGTINGNKDKLAVAGDSAGGNFAAVISQMVRDKNGPPITCQVLIYPSTNIYELNTKSWSYFAKGFDTSKEDMEKYISLYVPKKEERKNPYASPLLSKDFSKLPPALVITAEFDPLRDEGEAYAEKLKEAGVSTVVTRYTGVIHGFINMDRLLNEGDEAITQVSLFLQEKFQAHR